ncbi:OLC1v1020905C1 [Oldenlandia corymbosa var. corymbosa]|uniref:OLC1v1020905C1 n=1 Tax=Oldenlandia corymbosa var. corymbosa TaxID=529605 RepID=A0AAV1BV28_OLDCO|nr:OLC1v1020905C1 [Oldenlandia corymbosa var. corymbosa]
MASPSPRFLSLLHHPPDATAAATNPPIELDESDVVWSSSSAYSSDADSHSSPPHPPSTPPIHPRRHRPSHLNHPPFYGLSAALSDDHLPPLVRRKSTLNPSLSAAKMVPPSVVRPESPHLSPKAAPAAGGRYHQSAPVNVPVWPKHKKQQAGGNYLGQLALEVVDEDDDDDDEMVPPHVIVARSHVTFSVFEGVGRTLKGRDLRSVRNAVFQKTGFID